VEPRRSKNQRRGSSSTPKNQRNCSSRFQTFVLTS
ncbi:hypothetical protein AB1N83_011372, partial [Pleurotus pulmonarius]